MYNFFFVFIHQIGNISILVLLFLLIEMEISPSIWIWNNHWSLGVYTREFRLIFDVAVKPKYEAIYIYIVWDVPYERRVVRIINIYYIKCAIYESICSHNDGICGHKWLVKIWMVAFGLIFWWIIQHFNLLLHMFYTKL